MTQEIIQIPISLEVLVDVLAQLDLEDKLRVWQLLEEQLAQIEEDAWEQDPTIQSEIQEARAAFEAGDYVTLEDYMAQRQGPSE